jgi:hypothetical protein
MKIIAYQIDGSTVRIIYLTEDNTMHVCAGEDLNGLRQFVRHSCSNRLDNSSNVHAIAAMHNNK